MSNHIPQRDLARLEHLRNVLLGIESRPEGVPAPRYWESERDLELYDSTFAERIGWKWDAVLGELQRRGFVAPDGGALDYGCGTGVAGRKWLASEHGRGRPLTIWDRDAGARNFARQSLLTRFPDVALEELSLVPVKSDVEGRTLLVSHVLDELEPAQLDGLISLAHHAAAVVWVEPGSRLTSRRLSAVRDSLLMSFSVVAPCTHSERCGALEGDAARRWCHFFGEPSQEAFIEGRWAEFGRELGIDLRSLPYSFIALQRTPVPAQPTVRLLGRPRVQRGRALIDTCDAAGVHEEVLLQRLDKALFKELERGGVERLRLEREDGKITAAHAE